MIRRRAGLGLALFAAAAVGSGCTPAYEPPQRIVLIVVDTLRRDHLSCYGSENPTPAIDALAARGQRFTRTLASFHQTSMSMASLFTGLTPSIEFTDEQPLFWSSETWCGMSRFATPDDPACIPDSVPTLAESLREAGYWTIGVTSNQFLYEPGGFARGFDDWEEVGRRPRDKTGLGRLALKKPAETRYWRPVNRIATLLLNRRPNDRFFLYVHYMDVHDYHDRGVTYAESVRTVDTAIGRLLEKLEDSGLLEDAVVIFTADHGERLGEKHALPGRDGHIGNPSFLAHLEIPLIVAPPVDADAEAPLRSDDIHRLIRRIAGVDAGPEPTLATDELFVGELRWRTYLDGRYKTSLRRADDHLALFDLETDPGELSDVSAEHPEVVARHRERIRELSESLSARRAVMEKLSEDDRERLRALGYLDDLGGDD